MSVGEIDYSQLAEYVSEVEGEIGREHDDEKTRREKKWKRCSF